MNEKNKKQLCLFTIGFPFGKQVETFIESELASMDEVFGKVYIFPALYNDPVVRPLPEHFEVITLNNDWGKDGRRLFYSNLFFIMKILFFEFIFSNKKIIFIKKILKFKNILVHRLFIAEQLKEIIREKKLDNAVFYSYWLNDWTTSLGMLKSQNVIKGFVSRAHGFDIYEERLTDNIIPLRYFQLKMVDKVYSVSKKGFNYLKNKNVFPSKIAYSYLGVADKGINPFDEKGVFRLVSCSNLMSLKRVHLIVETLKNIKFQVHWVHFGDGDGDLLNVFKNKAKALPENIHYEFKGHLPNARVLDYYKSNSVNLFILLSESEGLPMSLIEACSFGIPLLATDVGGVSEIVNDKTGILIPENVDPLAVAKKISQFQKSNLNTKEFRLGVKQFWADNFHDTTNYKKFYASIMNS